jgi:hypothetical protein
VSLFDYKHKDFLAMAQNSLGDYKVEVIHVNSPKYGDLMTICAEKGPIYITKRQAMDFFNLRSAE